MFRDCTALTAAPALPATSLDAHCYQEMFSGCTALTVAPALPATSLEIYCYNRMFYGCRALTAAPELPASTLVDFCYYEMFRSCNNLNYVRCLATNNWASECTNQWLYGVASTGTFEKAPGMEHWTTGDSGIPFGWTIEGHDPIMYSLTFQAVEAGTITVKLDEGATLTYIEYNLNNTGWTYVGWGIPIDLAVGDVICFRGNNGTCCVYVPINEIWQPAGFHFECSNPCYVYGNMMSLIDKNNFATNTILTETFAFYSLFHTDEPNTTILNHPLWDIGLPATTLTANCYNSMFMNCQGITRAPTLPATTLAEGGYSSMFSSCTSLATTPILPATTLASQCYEDMFSGCEILTVAPELPATELYYKYYSGMFYGCLNLTTAPSLPATTLANNCYSSMFSGCIKLTAAPALPATTLAERCYDGMFKGCKNLTTAPALPAATLVNKCYQNMFYGCSNLNYVVCLATNISASYCVSNWLKDVANSGTFVKASSMSNWPSGNNGIPSGWTVKDIDEFTNNGNWNVAANWSNNAVTTAGSSVVIAANATIPTGYTANVKCIIINEGKTLTIADGGQFIHDNAGVVATVKKEISGYTNDDNGWNFIASPVTENLVSAQVSGLIPSGATVYDLYYLDEENTKWVNYIAHEGNADPGFDIVHNKGYLYANSGGTTINFSGPLQPYVAAGITLNLAKEGDGWNLVGNPFAFNAYANKSYYVINGRSVEPTSGGAISPCTGIVVQATGDNETVKFTKDNPNANSNQGHLNIVVAEQTTTRDGAPTGSATVDKAIVSFNEGSQLEKFVFNEGKAKLYIPQGQEEYAIATSGDSGEMPVNFHANENGTYTLTVNPENVEMGYLHLIDNMTGADIDLLTTPTYTFNAKTTDYASRFRLVFVARSVFGDEDSDDGNFAFFCNGNWIIANEGQATLQVIDLTGRILSSETVNGCVRKDINVASGIYLFRVINGNETKVQKVVIK